MIKAYKYRIYPNEDQANKIDHIIEVCRVVYNLALETKSYAYRSHGVSLSAYDLQKQFTQLRKEYDWIKDVGYQYPAEAIKNIDSSFKRFFNGNGYPQFKSKRNEGSFRCRAVRKSIDFDSYTMGFGQISGIKISVSRRFVGEIRNVVISKTGTGKYYASFLVKPLSSEAKAVDPNKGIGIDLGVNHFSVLSTGEKVENPRYLKSELPRLKVLQRRASRKKKGSNNRKKANLQVALLHEKITNQRNDFLHKLSTRLIRDSQTDTICVESLAVKNMVKNHKLAQAISDVSWSEFVRQLEYKGKWYGKNVIKIDRWFASSKICSDCNHKKDELNLDERTWQCPNCGSVHDRDINAAINIRNSGMGSPGEPVEPPAIVGVMKQEPMSKVNTIKPIICSVQNVKTI